MFNQLLKTPKSIIFGWSLFFVFVFTFLFNNSYKYLDPDLGWHLQVGKQIIIDKDVPRLDNYDFPLTGKNWVDHEWLINLIMYLFYNHLGYGALTFFFALLGTISIIILNLLTFSVFPELKNNRSLIMIMETFGLIAMSPHLGVRVQEFTILYILLLLIIINAYDKTKNWKIAATIPFLFFCLDQYTRWVYYGILYPGGLDVHKNCPAAFRKIFWLEIQ